MFIERLKDLRTDKGLSIRQLAAETGISFSQIARWERGKSEPTLSMIIKLCKYFEVTSDYLIGLKDY